MLRLLVAAGCGDDPAHIHERCLRGHSMKERGELDEADVYGALKAAVAVFDDHLEKISGRSVGLESSTHGTSVQRIAWFKRGMEGGQVSSFNTLLVVVTSRERVRI